jgi:hypothetical protein
VGCVGAGEPEPRIIREVEKDRLFGPPSTYLVQGRSGDAHKAETSGGCTRGLCVGSLPADSVVSSPLPTSWPYPRLQPLIRRVSSSILYRWLPVIVILQVALAVLQVVRWLLAQNYWTEACQRGWVPAHVRGSLGPNPNPYSAELRTSTNNYQAIYKGPQASTLE